MGRAFLLRSNDPIMSTAEQHTSERMAKVRQAGTEPELAVRNILRELGVHYRTQGKGLPGSPDIVNKESNWAIFVHGCFWHGHDCGHGSRKSKTNSLFWEKKISDNRARDAHKRHELESLGYLVLEVWECEIKAPNKLSERIRTFVGKARARLELYRFDQERHQVERIVRIGGQRSRSVRIEMSDASLLSLPPHECFDANWLRLQQRPPSSRNGAGSLSVADLFSGCGGLSLGVQEACRSSGRYFRSVLASDFSKDALQVYRDNFSPEVLLSDPIESHIDGELGAVPTSTEEKFLERLENIDMIVAGPPCQGHSNLNNHTRRSDERNALCLRVARFAELTEPSHVIIENVASSVHDEGRAMQETKKFLEKLEYRCDSATIDLWRLGVPQLRQRHLLVASRERIIDLNELVDQQSVSTPRSIRWAIGDLEDMNVDRLLDQPRNLSEENCTRIRWLFENGEYDLPNHLRPECHQGEHKYLAMYGRLRMDSLANTVTTGFGSPGQGRYIHPTRQRTLTAHEAARLQLFPDFFDFSSVRSYKALSKMIGNAVPMKASYIVTLALLAGE